MGGWEWSFFPEEVGAQGRGHVERAGGSRRPLDRAAAADRPWRASIRRGGGSIRHRMLPGAASRPSPLAIADRARRCCGPLPWPTCRGSSQHISRRCSPTRPGWTCRPVKTRRRSTTSRGPGGRRTQCWIQRKVTALHPTTTASQARGQSPAAPARQHSQASPTATSDCSSSGILLLCSDACRMSNRTCASRAINDSGDGAGSASAGPGRECRGVGAWNDMGRNGGRRNGRETGVGTGAGYHADKPGVAHLPRPLRGY